MLVAISQRHDKNRYGDFYDNLENNYVNYLLKFGIKLVPIPNCLDDVEAYLKDMPIQGIILSGGNMVNPKLFGGNTPKDADYSDQRDNTERKLLEIAIKNKLPVLGICRGMQFINVFFGGSLIYIREDIDNAIEHVRNDHQISGISETKVNSYHNFGVTDKTLGKGLKVFAKSSDGIIEGINHENYPIAGIEWHPERKSPDKELNKKIIEAFLNKKLFWKK